MTTTLSGPLPFELYARRALAHLEHAAALIEYPPPISISAQRTLEPHIPRDLIDAPVDLRQLLQDCRNIFWEWITGPDNICDTLSRWQPDEYISGAETVVDVYLSELGYPLNHMHRMMDILAAADISSGMGILCLLKAHFNYLVMIWQYCWRISQEPEDSDSYNVPSSRGVTRACVQAVRSNDLLSKRCYIDQDTIRLHLENFKIDAGRRLWPYLLGPLGTG